MTPEIKKQLEVLRQSKWEIYPSQDNEGFQPDFIGYKYGWKDGSQAAWDLADLDCLRRIEKVVIEMRVANQAAIAAAILAVANDALKSMARMITAYPIERREIEQVFYEKYFGGLEST